MKPFNLEQAKAGKPVRTGDGKPVRIICTDAKGIYPIIGLVDEGNVEVHKSWTNDGVLILDPTFGGKLDIESNLVMVEDTITINGIKVPKPESGAPRFGTRCFIPGITSPEKYSTMLWRDVPTDLLWLEHGLVHLTKENAIKHAKALLSFTKQDCGNPFDD